MKARFLASSRTIPPLAASQLSISYAWDSANLPTADSNRCAWSRERGSAYCDTITAAGFGVNVYRSPYRRAVTWTKEEPLITDWIKKLPKPIGLFVPTTTDRQTFSNPAVPSVSECRKT